MSRQTESVTTRAAAWLALAGCALIAAVICSPLPLPYQDAPNHELMLRIDRALQLGAQSPYLVASPIVAFGYTLYYRLDRALAWALPVAASLRLLFLIAALGLPLAARRLARACSVDPAWAMVLALPLALSWPLMMGFLSYDLALPFCLFAVAQSTERCRGIRVGLRPALITAACLALSYLAHPIGFVLAAAGIGLAWLWLDRSWRTALALNAIALPTVALLGYDCAVHAFAPTAGVDRLWSPAPTLFRDAGTALSHLVTRSYALADLGDVLWFLPFLIALAVTFVLAVAQRWRSQSRLPLVALFVGFAITVGSMFVPSSSGTIMLLSDRLGLVGLLLLSVFAVAGVHRLPRLARHALLATVLVALGHQCVRHVAQASVVHAAVGNMPHSLGGRLLTVRLGDCDSPPSAEWGGYDPGRHLWAYAIDPERGYAPYLFAFRRYSPFWIADSEIEAMRLIPTDQQANAVTPSQHCVTASTLRAKWLAWIIDRYRDDFDGVVEFGAPDVVGELVAGHLGHTEQLRFTPGLAGMRLESDAPLLTNEPWYQVQTAARTVSGASARKIVQE